MSSYSSPVRYARITESAFHSSSICNPWRALNAAAVGGKGMRLRQKYTTAGFGDYVVRFKLLFSSLSDHALILMGDLCDSEVGLAEILSSVVRDICGTTYLYEMLVESWLDIFKIICIECLLNYNVHNHKLYHISEARPHDGLMDAPTYFLLTHHLFLSLT